MNNKAPPRATYIELNLRLLQTIYCVGLSVRPWRIYALRSRQPNYAAAQMTSFGALDL